MIPTMIVFGLLTGRWWKTALVVGTAGWTLLLFVSGAITVSQAPTAALFGLVNTGAGVAIHRAVLWLLRRGRAGCSGHSEPASAAR